LEPDDAWSYGRREGYVMSGAVTWCFPTVSSDDDDRSRFRVQLAMGDEGSCENR